MALDHREVRAPLSKKSSIIGWNRMIAHIKGSLANLKGARPFRAKEARLLYGPALIYLPAGVMALWDIYIKRRWAREHGFSISGFVNGIDYMVDNPEWRLIRAEYERQMKQQTIFPRKKMTGTWRPSEISPGATRELASGFLASTGGNHGGN